MQIIVRGHGTEVTGAMKEYAHKKMGKLQEFYKDIHKAEVTLDVRSTFDAEKRQVAQVTLWLGGTLLRAEEASEDIYASIDIALANLENQIKKHKEKHGKEAKREGQHLKELNHQKDIEEVGVETLPASGPVIVRSKKFAVKPVSPEEAVEQMRILEHDFYMFRNAETNAINVVYRRREGNFGLIEPE